MRYAEMCYIVQRDTDSFKYCEQKNVTPIPLVPADTSDPTGTEDSAMLSSEELHMTKYSAHRCKTESHIVSFSRHCRPVQTKASLAAETTCSFEEHAQGRQLC
jgi:hypothetical protein